MNAVILDTDTISLYRKGRLPVDQVRQVHSSPLRVTFVPVGELHKWALVQRCAVARTEAARE